MRGVAATAATAVSVLTALSALAGSGPTSAAVIPEVSLDLARCTSLPRAAIARLVGLELDARVTAPDKAGPHAVRVDVACAATGVQLDVSDPLASRALTRTIAPAARESDAAARIVALAIAELVFTSWSDMSPAQAPASVTESPPPELKRAAQDRAQRHALGPAAVPASTAPPVTQTAAPPAPSLVTAAPAATGVLPGAAAGTYVLAVGEAIGPFERMGLGWGAGIRLGWTSGTPLFALATSPVRPGAELDLTAAWTEAPSASGTVRVSSWSASPRASLRLFARDGQGAWLDVAAGARLGVARLVGAPLDPTSTRGGSLAGTWGGAVAYAGIGFAVGSVVLATGIEGGRVLRSVSGLIDGDRSVAIAGQWLSGSLAVGWGRRAP